jgi:hypothetical protein
MRSMKTRRVTCIAVLIGAAVSLGWLLGYRDAGGPRLQRLNSVSNLKHIGLAFRMGRNDINAPFSVTGPVAAPNIRREER